MARTGVVPHPKSHSSSLQSWTSRRGLPGPSPGPQGGPHSARHTGGLKWAVPSPGPSVPLASRPWAQLSRGCLRSRNQMGERKALAQNGISIPHFPTPVPLVPRPKAASSSQRWGWRVGHEGGGEDLGASCPPPLSLSLLGLRAGSPGAVVSEADRSALSFLPAGGKGGAGWGAGSDALSPPLPLL